VQVLHRESVDVYESMLRLRPDDAEAFLNMFWAKKYACDWSHWDTSMVQVLLQCVAVCCSVLQCVAVCCSAFE